jgi:hypothetical protein
MLVFVVARSVIRAWSARVRHGTVRAASRRVRGAPTRPSQLERPDCRTQTDKLRRQATGGCDSHTAALILHGVSFDPRE